MNMTQETREPPARAHLLIAFVVLAIGSLFPGGPLFSMMCISSGVTLLFGVFLSRAAFLTRNDGWIAGATFGGIITLIGVAATAYSLFFFAAHASF